MAIEVREVAIPRKPDWVGLYCRVAALEFDRDVLLADLARRRRRAVWLLAVLLLVGVVLLVLAARWVALRTV